MDTLTDEQIEQRFAALPPEVQQAIESNHVDEHIQQIGARYGLHIDQLGMLKDATYLIMLGLTNPQEFASDIAEFAHVPAEQAATIAQTINAEVFEPIRHSMHQASESVHAVVPQAAPVTPVTTPAVLPMVPSADHMLAMPTMTSPQKMPVQAPSQAPKQVDPYREPIE